MKKNAYLFKKPIENDYSASESLMTTDKFDKIGWLLFRL